MSEELDREIAERVIGDARPALLDVGNWGLGMGEGYRGPLKSPKGAWVLRDNPEFKAAADKLRRRWKPADSPYIGKGNESNPEYLDDLKAYREIPMADWFPKPFSTSWGAALWALNAFYGRHGGYWELSFDPDVDSWDEPYDGYVMPLNGKGGYDAKLKGEARGKTPEEAMARAMLRSEDAIRREALDGMGLLGQEIEGDREE